MGRYVAEWRFPTEKQMAAIATDAARRDAITPPAVTGVTRIGDVKANIMRLECGRCPRIIEIQTVDAIRLCGSNGSLSKLARQLQDQGCEGREGNRDDGCWPRWRF